MPLPTPDYSLLTIIASDGRKTTYSPVVPVGPNALHDVWESTTDGLTYIHDGIDFVLAQPGPAVDALQSQMAQALDGISTNAQGLAATNATVAAGQQTDTLQSQQIAATQATQTAAQQAIVNLTSRVAALEAAGTTPAVPQAPTLSAPGTIANTSVQLIFTPAGSGPAATSFQTAHAAISGGSTGAFTNGPSGASSPIVVTGLTSGQQYAFHVAGVNAAGTGPVSNQVTATTTTTFTPSVAFFQIPRDGSTITTNNGQTVTISAPDATGGHAMVAPLGSPGSPVALGVSTFVDTMFIDASGAIWQHSADPAASPGGLYFVPASFVPTSAWTYSPSDPRPGAPPSGNATTAAIISFIGSQAGNHVMVGQYNDSATEGIGDATAFTAATGKHVAILGDGYWPLWGSFIGAAGTAGRTVAQINADATAHWNAGGLVYMNIAYPDPIGGNMYGSCTPSQVITPGTPQYNFIHAYYDQCIAALLPLRAAGVIVIFRPYFENRWNFWWGMRGSSGWDSASWQILWQQHYNYISAGGTTGTPCDHLIWVLSQWSFPGDGTTGNVWGDTYPGDSYVNLIGEDVYTNNAPDYSSLYAAERIAHPTKPWVMAEWGAGSPSQGNFNFNMQTLINDIKNSLPATCFFQAWTGSSLPFGWRLANMQNLVGAMNDPYVLVRENLGRP